MGESLVQVTEGSGKKLHTWQRTIGANNVEDEFVLPGEYPLPTYVATSTAVGISVANDHIFQIMAGSSLKVRIRLIEAYLWTLTTSSTLHRLSLFRLSTAGTGGTVITPRPYDTADAASGATCMTLPTAKGTETVNLANWGPVVATTVASVVNDGTLIRKRWEWTGEPLIIPSGTANGIALKNISTQAAGQIAFNVEFVETSF